MNHFFPRDFTKPAPTATRAKGIYIWDARGKKYLDAASGAAVASIGHGSEAVARAVARQLNRLSFVHSSQFVSAPALDLTGEIARFAGGEYRRGRVYLCTGGSEAVETAVKLARAYHLERKESSRSIVVSRTHSYHGATLGCLNYGGHSVRRRPYEAMLDGQGAFTRKIPAAYCYRCPWGLRPESCDVPCADELDTEIRSAGARRVSAFIAEPVSGATLAAAVPSERYWPRIREICDRHGVLLIADEVMTGFGRLGANLGLDLWKVGADITAFGKGISGGYLPLAGVLAGRRVCGAIAEGSGRFEHGFTSHGHPVSSAAGLAVLQEIRRQNLVRNAAERSSGMRAGLLRIQAKFPLIGDVRGTGLLWGLEFVRDPATRSPFPSGIGVAARVGRAAFKRGLIVYPGAGFVDGSAGDHIMIAPPLIVTEAQVAEMLDLLTQAIRDAARQL